MPDTPTEFGQHLRRRAEQLSRQDKSSFLQELSAEETQHILHELRVHQIELEMQNEELRRTQSELEASRARYFDLYDLAPVGYLTFGDKGLIREANLAAATLLGVARGELVNHPMSQFIFPGDQDCYYLHRKRVIDTGVQQVWEMRLERADGSPFWVHMQATFAHNGEFWLMFHDISDRKLLEQEVLEFEQQFRQIQKLESLGVLAGGIAHDFNNLLAIIIGHCSLAKLKPATLETNIMPIEKAAVRAAELCRQMLAYAGKSTFNLTQVNVTKLVDEIVKMLRSTIKQNVMLTTRFPVDIPLITADASQISQIAMNLIINAAEAIGNTQGEIQVSLANAEIAPGQSHKDHLGKVIPPGSYICLEVTDSGCGMDDETRLRIFEPFYTTKFTGRGLGMSAVLGIITAHKGALQLHSRPDQGSTFKVYLPVQISETAENMSLQQQLTSPPWRGSGTILLVEDELQVQMVARIMLQELGFNVVEAANGKEALQMYQKNISDITLVVTDVDMPVMDGYELFHELNKLNPKLPIIVSSGFGDLAVTTRIPREKIAGIISKPYNFEQLRKLLKGVLESCP